MVLIICATSVIIAYISPSGKHEPQREDHPGFPETSVVEFWGFTMVVDEV